jgi:hypothetical protein
LDLDHIRDSNGVSKDLIVWYPEDSEPHALKICRPLSVPHDPMRVNYSFRFENNIGWDEEIDEVVRYSDLLVEWDLFLPELLGNTAL